MKIEKVNDHQIRCTLTKADLADGNLKSANLLMEQKRRRAFFVI